MNRIEAKRPRVIRRVVRLHKAGSLKGRPKIARDRRALYSIEQIRAGVGKACFGTCGEEIEKGTYFARVVGPDDRRLLGRRAIPDPKDYHFACVPKPARPLVRFFVW